MRLTTHSPEETRSLGTRLGRLLGPGDTVTLEGELGAGKTVLAQGIALGLEVEEPVSSPTFALVHEYRGRVPVWHLDAYRLRGPGDLVDLGWDEIAAGGGAVLVEWPERIREAIPPDRVEAVLRYGPGERREIELAARGRLQSALAALEEGGEDGAP